jgi:hypothetical protein
VITKATEEVVQAEEEVQYVIDPNTEMNDKQLRLQLLSLSKDILEHQSHLMWETHKNVVDVSIEDIVAGAGKLLDFVEGVSEDCNW